MAAERGDRRLQERQEGHVTPASVRERLAPLHTKSSNSQQIAPLPARLLHSGCDKVRELTYPSGENVMSRCEKGSSFTGRAGNKNPSSRSTFGDFRTEKTTRRFLFSPTGLFHYTPDADWSRFICRTHCSSNAAWFL